MQLSFSFSAFAHPCEQKPLEQQKNFGWAKISLELFWQKVENQKLSKLEKWKFLESLDKQNSHQIMHFVKTKAFESQQMKFSQRKQGGMVAKLNQFKNLVRVMNIS